MATRTRGSKKSKFDLYEAITNRILEALDKDIIPWRKPWTTRNGNGVLHRNFVSKHPYRGINLFLLEFSAIEGGYSLPYWMTFKQISEKGGKVRQGEHGTMVVLWKPISYKPKPGQRCVKCYKGEYTTGLTCNACGQEAPSKAKTFLLRYYKVFNIEQTEGLKLPKPEPRVQEEFDPIERAEQIIKDMPQRPKMSWGGDAAYYSMLSDSVRLPGKTSFDTPSAYYATAYHELAHATGHESRVGRKGAFGNSFGEEKYAKEELVAEMTASMVCAVADIDPDVTNSASYVRHWMSKADYQAALRNDHKLVLHAAAQAQKAADFILGEQPQENGSDES